MNRFLFIMILIPAGAMAQTLPAAQRPLQPVYKSQLFAADTTRPDWQALPDRKTTNAWLARAKRSHTTSRGTVYIMPIDQMPCLVPYANKNAPMPAMRPRLNKRMPNGFEVPPVKPDEK
jgi:hypothetical protein